MYVHILCRVGVSWWSPEICGPVKRTMVFWVCIGAPVFHSCIYIYIYYFRIYIYIWFRIWVQVPSSWVLGILVVVGFGNKLLLDTWTCRGHIWAGLFFRSKPKQDCESYKTWGSQNHIDTRSRRRYYHWSKAFSGPSCSGQKVWALGASTGTSFIIMGVSDLPQHCRRLAIKPQSMKTSPWITVTTPKR